MFNIAIDSILDFDFIYPIIKRFYALEPDIEINIYEEVLGGACETLISGRADLVIGAGPELAEQEHIEIQDIQQIEWVFAVAPGHGLADAPQDSISMAWKSANQGKVLRWFIEQLSNHRFSTENNVDTLT